MDQVQVQPNETLVLDQRRVDGKWHGSAMFLRVIWQLSCMISFGKNMVTGDDVTPWGTDLLGVKVQSCYKRYNKPWKAMSLLVI